jgi:hypothetical protein
MACGAMALITPESTKLPRRVDIILGHLDSRRESRETESMTMLVFGPPRQLDDGLPRKSEDDIQQELGPRGVPGIPSPANMTAQRDENAEPSLAQDRGEQPKACVDHSQ